jgi:hypothetical protein
MESQWQLQKQLSLTLSSAEQSFEVRGLKVLRGVTQLSRTNSDLGARSDPYRVTQSAHPANGANDASALLAQIRGHTVTEDLCKQPTALQVGVLYYWVQCWKLKRAAGP